MKKKLWITICFIFALCGMVLMTVPTQAKTSKNSNDVKYLKALIKEQKKQGATVSSDINNKKQYEWSKSGRIKCIYWRNKKLKGVIDISRFEGLKDFYCNKNKITELKLNKTLMNLDCSDNEISFLDASKCVLDYSLTCNRNKIKKLKLKSGTQMRYLECSGNILENIDISKCSNLEELDIHNNKITELDLSNVCQDYLYKLICDEDVKIIGQKKWIRLEYKYIKNNVAHYSFDLGGDNLLFRISVSDSTYPVGKNKEDVSNLYKLFSKMDKNFQWVAYDSSRYWELGWDKKTGRLISVNLNGVNIKGTLDLNTFTELKTIKCSNNKITELKIDKLKKLKKLYCNGNNIKKINLSQNKKIETIYLSGNKIKTLNIRNLKKLAKVKCNNNNLTEIKLKNNKALKYIECKGNPLSEKVIKKLAKKTRIKSDKIKKRKSVKKIIGVKGKNKDDVKYLSQIIKSQNKKGAKLPYNLNSYAYEWSDNGRLETISWNNSGLKGELNFNYFGKIKFIEVNNNEIITLKVSKCKKLISLKCRKNHIKRISLTKGKNIMSLDCSYNNIAILDVSKNQSLDDLCCSNNQIQKIKISTSLEKLYCNNNKLKTLDVKDCYDLTELNCNNNKLEKLELNNKLMVLKCNNNKLNSLKFYDNGSNLYALECKNNRLEELNIQGAKLIKLTCSHNRIEKLNLEGSDIDFLYCKNNKLKELDLTKVTVTETLNCSNNQIEKIEMGNSPIEIFNCSNNRLKTLDITDLKKLKYLDCSSNEIEELITGNLKVKYIEKDANTRLLINASKN